MARVFVERDEGGETLSFGLEDAEPEGQSSLLRGAPKSIEGLIREDDFTGITAALPAGTTAMIVLFEHVWLRDLGSAIEASGGRVLISERIPGEVVDAVEDAALEVTTERS